MILNKVNESVSSINDWHPSALKGTFESYRPVMLFRKDEDLDVPGTEVLADVNNDLDVTHDNSGRRSRMAMGTIDRGYCGRNVDNHILLYL